MIAIVSYLIKAGLISLVLCGYYHWFLKEKTCHRWNRFFLLTAVVVSLLLPMVSIDVFTGNKPEGFDMIQLLTVVNASDDLLAKYDYSTRNWWTAEMLILLVYGMISLTLLVFLMVSMFGIYRASRKKEILKMGKTRFIESELEGAPFSFFNIIFWNMEIDIHSETGKKIIDHEFVHIRQRHSFDKLFLEIVLVCFWFLPAFWFIRRELRQLHEYLADRETIAGTDSGMLARLILHTSYPSMYNIVNPFFQTSLKRRISMIKKSSHPGTVRTAQLFALPLGIALFLAFTIRPQQQSVQPLLENKVTVVIDAGHGANDPGVSFEGLREKDLTLSIARLVKSLNEDDNLTVILTRNNDEQVSLPDRTEIAREKNADLFISLHIGNDDRTRGSKTGIEVYIPNNHAALNRQSQLLASALVQNFRPYYKVSDSIYERNSGIWVLNKNYCPAALVEIGYINNADDRNFISLAENQEKIARGILKSIGDYFSNIDEKTAFTIIPKPEQKPLVLIGDKEASEEEVKQLDKDKIKSVSVWKNDEAIKKYGEKGRHGVIVIELK